MKRAGFLVVGLCAFLCALGFAFILRQYLAGGAGLQFFGLPVSSESVLLGLVHVLGFGFAALLCFAAGAGLCAQAIVPESDTDREEEC